MSIFGITILSAQKAMGLKKRNRAIQIGDCYYVHPKTYKGLRKVGKSPEKLQKLLMKIKVSVRISKSPIFSLSPVNSFYYGDPIQPIRTIWKNPKLKSQICTG